jgi:hypothetical protein
VSVESIAIALHHSRARNSTARMVLVGIANHDGDGGAWPTIRTLAHYAGVQDRAVQKALLELIQLGEVLRDVQAGGTAEVAHYDRPNLYHFVLKCPPHCDGSRAHKLICEGCGKPMPKDSHSVRFHPACAPEPVRQHPVSVETPGVREDTGGVSTGTPKTDIETSVNYEGGEIHSRSYVGNRASARELDASGADLPASAGASAQAAQAPTNDASGDSHRPAGASTAPDPHNVPSTVSTAADGDSEACPRWRGSMPHTPDQHGKCIDCGAPVLVVDPSTGEVQ